MARYTSLDEQKYGRIREAAIQLFYEQGIERTTIAQIAATAGIGKGTVYLYFPSREALVEDVFNHCYQRELKACAVGVEKESCARTKLLRRIENLLRWNRENPAEAAVKQMAYQPVNIAGIEGQPATPSYMENRKLIQEGIETGEFKDLPLDLLCRFFFSAVEGICGYMRDYPAVLDDPQSLQQALDALLYGIAKQ